MEKTFINSAFSLTAAAYAKCDLPHDGTQTVTRDHSGAQQRRAEQTGVPGMGAVLPS
jgi:hypothetical protein